MAVEPQVQQFIDFIRDEMPRRIKTNPNSLPDAEKLLVSVSGTLEVIYKTLAELDIAIKGDVDTELSNKEPSITAGSNTQYWRGDKTFQTLDAAAVAETEGRVYLSPEQKTVATQAASDTLNGYLTSTDWSTFNGKQNALSDVITADTYGSSTQYPVITFNAKGIATGVTLQTVSVAEVSDSVFRIVDNDDNTKKMYFEVSGVTAGQPRTVTMADKAVNLGDLPSVATTDINNLSGTRTRILGGQTTTVAGTDNIAVGCTSTSLASAGVGNYAEFCRSLTLTSNNKNCRFTGLRNDYGTPLTFSLGGDVEYVSYTGWLNSILVGARLPKGYRCVGGYRNSPTISGFASWNTSVASVETLLYGVSDGTAVSLTCADDTANAPQSPVPSIGYHCVIHELDLSAVSSGTGMFVGRRLIKQIFQGGSVTTTVDTVGTDATAGGFTISLAADSSSTVNGVYTLSIAVKNTANTSKVIWQGRLRSLVHHNDYTF